MVIGRGLISSDCSFVPMGVRMASYRPQACAKSSKSASVVRAVRLHLDVSETCSGLAPH